MGLFSKKSDKNSEFDKLPELPQLPKSISTYQPAIMNNQNIVPQSTTTNWNIQAVKEAVKGEENGNYTQDFSDLASSGEREVMMGMDKPRTRPTNYPAPTMVTNQPRREPLFVRIDKFENALRDFEDISIKIKRVEEIITDIKELREKEDREFSEWEKDLQIVKSRLDSIDRTLFSQLD